MQFASRVGGFPREGFSPRLSVPSALDHDGPRHNIVHSPVVLEEEESDEDGEEEGDGEVLVERSHCGPGKKRRNMVMDRSPPLPPRAQQADGDVTVSCPQFCDHSR